MVHLFQHEAEVPDEAHGELHRHFVMLLPGHGVDQIQGIQQQMGIELKPELGEFRFLVAEFFLVQVYLQGGYRRDQFVEIVVDLADFRDLSGFREALAELAAAESLCDGGNILHRLCRKAVEKVDDQPEHGSRSGKKDGDIENNLFS